MDSHFRGNDNAEVTILQRIFHTIKIINQGENQLHFPSTLALMSWVEDIIEKK